MWHSPFDSMALDEPDPLPNHPLKATEVVGTNGDEYCYLLSMRWFSLEEERVMQQSSEVFPLVFENQGINLVGDYTQPTR